MRPWKLASETATLDNLSNGRVILAVGLGAVDTGFAEFGEVTDRKTRAELLDEGLDILNGLWRGQPFSYDGKHYQIKPTEFMLPPPPVQQPRIPIWTVGAWPRPKSMRRVLRCDGILPVVMSDDRKWGDVTPDAIREIRAFVEANRAEPGPFDIVMEGETPGDNADQAAAIVGGWADAGATWWLETRWELPRDAEGLKLARERVLQGPPRLE
jgi:alkanesulfonate monooxygenase SsuD/methylene tetrahydromethanopterin reductase-like flavin-dependent oxidoreductase (luciferase family)